MKPAVVTPSSPKLHSVSLPRISLEEGLSSSRAHQVMLAVYVGSVVRTWREAAREALAKSITI